MNNLYERWKEKYKKAKDNMVKRANNKGILIEVAAQHPLIDGCKPNEEFSKRLNLAIELYNKFRNQNTEVKIYVPGSLHKDNDIVDKISLSTAGRLYLLDNGIEASDIFAEDANEKYKGEIGVYNSTDECFVASEIFKELEYGELHCVCSSGQMMRKVFSYISFGFVPFMHTVSCSVMYHDYVDEYFRFIPILLEDANSLQGDSKEADRLRKERKPV